MRFIIKEVCPNDGPVQFYLADNQRYGLISREGTVILKPILRRVNYNAFDENGVAVADDGFINSAGKFVIKPRYSFIRPSKEKSGVYITRMASGCVGIVNTAEPIFKLSSKRISNIFEFQGEVAYFTDNRRRIGLLHCRQGVLIKATFDEAEPFSHCGVAMVAKGGKWGLINNRGEVVCPLEWDELYGIYGGYEGMKKREGVRARFTDTGYFLDNAPSNGEFKSFSGFYEGGVTSAFFQGRYCLIDEKGQVIRNLDWDEAGFMKYGLVPVRQGENWGIVDRQGEVLLAPEWDKVSIRTGRYLCVEKNGNKQLLDLSSGKVEGPFDGVYLNKGYVFCIKDLQVSLWTDKGFLNTFNLPCETCTVLNDHRFLVYVDELYGIHDGEKWIVKPQWKEAYSSCPDNWLVVKYDNAKYLRETLRMTMEGEQWRWALANYDGKLTHVQSFHINFSSGFFEIIYDASSRTKTSVWNGQLELLNNIDTSNGSIFLCDNYVSTSKVVGTVGRNKTVHEERYFNARGDEILIYEHTDRVRVKLLRRFLGFFRR